MDVSSVPRPVSETNVRQGRVVIVTGERGSGKTTACLELIERARRSGLECAGLVSPAQLAGGARIGADVVDIRTGESRPFTFEGKERQFDHQIVAWAAKRVERACPCDLLVVDEMGPLELIHGTGWRNALDVIGSCDCRLAVIVVRPTLVDAVVRELEERLPASSQPSIVTPQQLGTIEFGSSAPDYTGAQR